MSEPTANLLNGLSAYRPLFFEKLSGITTIGSDRLLLCDKRRGMLTEVDLTTETEGFSKTYDVEDFAEVYSICFHQGFLYSVYQNRVYVAEYDAKNHLNNRLLLEVPGSSDLTGIEVTEKTIYLATEHQSLLAYDRETEAIANLAETPGIGIDDLCYFQGDLWIVDEKEQTIYVFDLTTCAVRYEILTPFDNPTGITPVYSSALQRDILYVSYSRPSFEVYDTGDSQFELNIQTHYDAAKRDVVTDNFIYPLVYEYDTEKNLTRSNGFLIEMYYVEKLHALPEVADEYGIVKDLEWKISLPMNTDRQRVLSVEPIGSFEMRIEEIAAEKSQKEKNHKEEHRKVAVFSIPELDLSTERRVFGWKAVIQTFSIRYCIRAEQTREISETELQQYAQYLEDEEGLDLNRRSVKEAAREAIAPLSKTDQTNVLKRAEAIRDYIYKTLDYELDREYRGTEDILRDGKGSCGEYLSVFLSLLRLNQIPTRTCGNYKVPAYKMQAGVRSMFLSPDFNHVWLQIYLPDWGWVPIESSADDEAGEFYRWSKRFFLGLAWYHIECRAGCYFEEVFERGSDQPFHLSSADLAKNDIKFKVIRELTFDD